MCEPLSSLPPRLRPELVQRGSPDRSLSVEEGLNVRTGEAHEGDLRAGGPCDHRPTGMVGKVSALISPPFSMAAERTHRPPFRAEAYTLLQGPEAPGIRG